MTTDAYDVLVVGGGAAGLSGAVALARSRRRVLVVDDGTPRNAPAEGVHNFLGHDGIPPADLLAAGRTELARYGGEVVSGEVRTARACDGGGFRVYLADGRAVSARRLLVTTGLVDELPDVPGLAERWGRDVLHCPYCHGWEVRDQAIGVLARGPLAVHQALLFRQLSTDVVVFVHGAEIPDSAREECAAVGIRVVDGEVVGLEVTADRLTGVRLRSGEVVARQALAVQARATARAEVLGSLGLEAVEFRIGEHVVGSYVPAGPGGRARCPGCGWPATSPTSRRRW
jgi:thioredoxin reductase